MKMRYCIGFFAAIFFLVSMIGIGYQLSYRYAVERQQAKVELAQNEESVTTKGSAEKNMGYYLCELHGYVVVYLSDKTTIFEFTDISLDELPDNIQEEIRSGKFLETEDALYGFLENYSS